MKKLVNQYGGLPFLITIYLISMKFFTFNLTVIVMLATILWELKRERP